MIYLWLIILQIRFIKCVICFQNFLLRHRLLPFCTLRKYKKIFHNSCLKHSFFIFYDLIYFTYYYYLRSFCYWILFKRVCKTSSNVLNKCKILDTYHIPYVQSDIDRIDVRYLRINLSSLTFYAHCKHK